MYPCSLLSIPNVSSKSWQRNGLVVPSVRETWQGKLEANPNQVYILFLSPPETRNLQIKRQWQYLHRRHHRTDFKSFIFRVEGTFAEHSANIEYVGHFWCLGQLQWSALCRDFPSVAIQVNLLLYWPVSALQSSQAAWSLRNLLRRETSHNK